MIDPTKSPVTAQRRYATVILLTVLVAVAVWVMWTKELHHSKSASSSPTTPTSSVTAPAQQPHRSATTTTIPGGIPVSARNPFGG